jgi:hypothetical protein
MPSRGVTGDDDVDTRHSLPGGSVGGNTLDRTNRLLGVGIFQALTVPGRSMTGCIAFLEAAVWLLLATGAKTRMWSRPSPPWHGVSLGARLRRPAY